MNQPYSPNNPFDQNDNESNDQYVDYNPTKDPYEYVDFGKSDNTSYPYDDFQPIEEEQYVPDGNSQYINNQRNSAYYQPPTEVPKAKPVNKGNDTNAVVGLICGIVAFFFNPLYIPTIIGCIFGFIALSKADKNSKSLATAALIVAFLTGGYQLIFDIIFIIPTFGLCLLF